MMESIKKDRKKAIQKMRRKFDLVQMSSTYFSKLMETRRALLVELIEKSKYKDAFYPNSIDLEYRKNMKERRVAELTNKRNK